MNNLKSLVKKIDNLTSNNSDNSLLFVIKTNNLAILSSIHYKDKFNYIIKKLISLLKVIYSKNSILEQITENTLCLVLTNYPSVDSRKEASKIYQNVQSLQIDSKPIHLSISIGSVRIPQDETNGYRAYDKAFLAMKNVRYDLQRYYMSYLAYQVYHKEVILKHEKIAYFKKAILEKRIKLSYQPVVDSKTRELAYYECLLRIVNNDGSISSAGPYITIAEEMNFIDMIDEIVIDMVYEELKLNPKVKFSFNLSSIGIYNDEWIRKARLYFVDRDIAQRVIIEITETAAQKDLAKSKIFIEELQAMGCKVALDDFGAGYTSFCQLKNLPINIVKIDGNFIVDLLSNPNSKLFIELLCKLKSKINFKLVAEYVENEEIATILENLGVHFLQGHYFSAALHDKPWNN